VRNRLTEAVDTAEVSAAVVDLPIWRLLVDVWQVVGAFAGVFAVFWAVAAFRGLARERRAAASLRCSE
jgi:hypothetical protein